MGRKAHGGDASEVLKQMGYGCGLEAAREVIGGKWKVLILWTLGQGPLRFGELRREIPGISEKMLIQSLKEMEQDGIVSRTDHKEVPPRVDYAMTEFGHSLCEALAPLCAWGQEHVERISACKGQGMKGQGMRGQGARRQKVA